MPPLSTAAGAGGWRRAERRVRQRRGGAGRGGRGGAGRVSLGAMPPVRTCVRPRRTCLAATGAVLEHGGDEGSGWSVRPRRRLGPAGNGPTGDMETRKWLGPSVPGTGVARDSEARDPRRGRSPRLGGGARTYEEESDGGASGTERGAEVCAVPLPAGLARRAESNAVCRPAVIGPGRSARRAAVSRSALAGREPARRLCFIHRCRPGGPGRAVYRGGMRDCSSDPIKRTVASCPSTAVVPVGDTGTIINSTIPYSMRQHAADFVGAAFDARKGAGDGSRWWYINTWALSWSRERGEK